MKIVNGYQYQIKPNTREDCTKAFFTMLSENPNDTTFILEKGRYDFNSDKAILKEYYLSNSDVVNPRKLAILLSKMKNVVLNGNDSTLIFHGQVMPITIDECENVTVKNLVIDWDIPLTAEGKIVEANKDYVDVKIDNEKFPHKVVDNKLFFTGENWEEPVWNWGNHEYDSRTKKVAYRSGDTFSKATQELLCDGTIRFHGEFEPVPHADNYLVLRHNMRIHSGMFIVDSKDVEVCNVTIHCTGGLGLLSQFCNNLHFKNVKIIPNEEKGRVISSGHDDGIHLSCNMGHILVEECYFFGLLDDPLNIHGVATRITKKVNAKTLLGEFAHPQSLGFDKWALNGHEISLIKTDTMESIGSIFVDEFKLITPNTFSISFRDSIPENLEVGDSLENLTRTASITCRNNFFGNCRARGILISTPKTVIVEDNIFESSGAAILIAGDASNWYESGNSKDVLIQNNVFGDCCLTSEYQGCDAVISIHPELDNPDKEIPFHRNIKIIHNFFQMADIPVLYALSTCGLTFEDNKIFRSYTYDKWHNESSMLTFECCSDVIVKNNKLIGTVQGRDIAFKGMNRNDIEVIDTDLTSVFER